MRKLRATSGGHELDVQHIEWLETASVAHVACRDVGHAWPIDEDSMRWRDENYRNGKVWARYFECMHECGVTKIERRYMDTGEYLQPRYQYPVVEKGERSPYLLPLGAGRMTKADVFFGVQQLSAQSSKRVTKPRTAGAKTRQGRARKAA